MKTKFESHHLIRDTDGTGETDYGMMSVYEIGGIQFVARAGQAEYLRGATVVTTQEIPAFVSHITLRVVINVNYKEVWIYSLKKEDIRALGEKLSVGRRLTAVGYARIYAMWLDGKLVDGPKPLSTFYTNITEEQEESFRF